MAHCLAQCPKIGFAYGATDFWEFLGDYGISRVLIIFSADLWQRP